ncbi:hypothetical protein [Thioflexithrix psekupsensis]|uniref:Argininosuccinate lyase n=1 Tax=Thioflexithrix psekupsensis TaxID=1570016 RepID=A0A251X6L9_9GAMM|nr:hypothetical protein [Thioflexithrix psekupsensis]OUD13111.1 hypothetical protein TPSD3_10705 [Thioflexithrix psekupsensis]
MIFFPVKRIFFTGLLTALIALPMANLSAADSYNRRVLVVNNTSMDLVEFYGSNTGTEEWEEDVLDVDVLPSGEEVEVNFNDNTGYCMFDFLMVFSDGTELTHSRFNVCDYGTFTITE